MRSRMKHRLGGILSSGGTLNQRTARGIAWNFVSNGGTEVLSFARAVVLARLLSPGDFGLMGAVFIVVSAMGVFTEMGLGPALIHLGKAGGHEFEDTAWLLQVIRGLLLFAVLMFTAPYIALFFGEPRLEPMLRVIAFTFVLSGFNSIGLTLLRRDMQFQKLTGASLTTEALCLAATVAAAVLLRNVWALVIGEVFRTAVWLAASFVVSPFRPTARFSLVAARQLLHYGKNVFGSGLLVYVGTEGDDVLVGKLLGAEPLGFYRMAYRLSNLPATSVTQVISRVAFPAYVELRGPDGDLRRVHEGFLKILKATAMLSVPLAGIIAALAPELVSVVLGPTWLPIIPAVMVLAVFGLERSIGAVLGAWFLGIGRPQALFRLQLLKVLVMVLVIYPLTVSYGIVGTSVAVTISAVAVQIAGLATAARTLGHHWSAIPRTLEVPFAGTGFLIGTIVLVRKVFLLEPSLTSLFLLLVCGLSVYCGFLLLVDRKWLGYLVYSMRQSVEGRSPS